MSPINPTPGASPAAAEYQSYLERLREAHLAERDEETRREKRQRVFDAMRRTGREPKPPAEDQPEAEAPGPEIAPEAGVPPPEGGPHVFYA